MEYPIVITDEGATVKPLSKHVSSHYSSNVTYPSPTKEEVVKAEAKAVHSGFVEGARVKIFNNFTKETQFGEVLGFKAGNEQSYFKYQSDRTLDDITFIKVRVKGTNTTYNSSYALSELELA